MSNFENISVKWQDSDSADAFGRARISNVSTILDSKQLHDKQPLIWDEQTNGTATSVHSTTANSTTMSVSSNGDFAIRQTKQRPNYQPGKSPLIEMTFTMNPAVNTVQRVGSFNASLTTPFSADIDGIYLEHDGVEAKFCVAKNGVVESIAQSSWNIPDGITIDWTKSQILKIDYQYLGVGRVRCGLSFGGPNYILAEFDHANLVSGIYMGSPNHSLRYEIRSTGGTASLEHICSTVISEGGEDITGIKRASDLGIGSVIDGNTIGTYYALLGLRLKTTCLDSTIDVLDKSIISVGNTSFNWRLLLNPTVAGTFTYNDESNSCAQIAKGDLAGNPSTTTVTGGILLDSGYVSDRLRQSTGELNTALRIGSGVDGTRDEIVLCVSPSTSNEDFLGSISWIEAL